MRLWSLHPKYLDPCGLVALWREALLAQAVLRGETRGYREHPQLQRFRVHPQPLAAIGRYLMDVYNEAENRGYAFNKNKINPVHTHVVLAVTSGQIMYEWQHLLIKLSVRNPQLYQKWQSIHIPEAHPLFKMQTGAIEPWERQHVSK